jgi:hypothetical protein
MILAGSAVTPHVIPSELMRTPRACRLTKYKLIPPSRRNRRDETSPASKGDVTPQPVDRDNETISKANQKVDVRDAPKQPADNALEPNGSELHYSGAPSDCGQVAPMSVSEWWQRPTREARYDRPPPHSHPSSVMLRTSRWKACSEPLARFTPPLRLPPGGVLRDAISSNFG